MDSEEELEVYAAGIPAAAAAADDDTDMPFTDDVTIKELNDMKKRLKEMEEEAAALRELQAKIDSAQGSAALQASKLEADSRSVYVGNVDYSCTVEELHQHFESCGTINRVTIPTDTFGQPKGFAYVEFQEVDAVQNAILLHETELHGRQLKVVAKRTNVPGMKHFPCRLFSPYIGYGYRMPYGPAGFDSPYGYGRVPRFKRAMRYMPYY